MCRRVEAVAEIKAMWVEFQACVVGGRIRLWILDKSIGDLSCGQVGFSF